VYGRERCLILQQVIGVSAVVARYQRLCRCVICIVRTGTYMGWILAQCACCKGAGIPAVLSHPLCTCIGVQATVLSVSGPFPIGCGCGVRYSVRYSYQPPCHAQKVLAWVGESSGSLSAGAGCAVMQLPSLCWWRVNFVSPLCCVPTAGGGLHGSVKRICSGTSYVPVHVCKVCSVSHKIHCLGLFIVGRCTVNCRQALCFCHWQDIHT
jgi:hypothetical protein